MPSEIRLAVPRPWRTALRESKTVGSTPGKALDAILGVIAIWVAREFFGGSGMVELALAFVGGAFVLPAAEILWRRVRGPLKTLATENVRGIRRIEELEKELWRLQHPDPLDLDVSKIAAGLEGESATHADASPFDTGYLLTIAELSLTSRSNQNMILEAEVAIRLRKPSLSRKRMTITPYPVELKNREGKFPTGVIKVPPLDHVSVNLAFLAMDYQMTGAWGISNIAEEGHVLSLTDRVTKRKLDVTFDLRVYLPSTPDTEPPPSTEAAS